MKYWNALNALETQIIRLDSMNSLLNVLAEGVETSGSNDIRNAVWYIQGSIQDINEQISEKFTNLFNAVRDEGFGEEEFSDEKEYSFEPLQQVVNSWAKQ